MILLRKIRKSNISLLMNHFSDVFHPVVKLVTASASKYKSSFCIKPVKLSSRPWLSSRYMIHSLLWITSSKFFKNERLINNEWVGSIFLCRSISNRHQMTFNYSCHFRIANLSKIKWVSSLLLRRKKSIYSLSILFWKHIWSNFST